MRLEFELAYYDSADQHVSHYAIQNWFKDQQKIKVIFNCNDIKATVKIEDKIQENVKEYNHLGQMITVPLSAPSKLKN